MCKKGAFLWFVVYGYSYISWAELLRSFRLNPVESIGLGLLGIVALGVTFAGSTMLLNLGRKLELLEPDDYVIGESDEPVVLYLRSFAQDKRSEDEWAHKASSFTEGLTPILTGTTEERLLRRLRVFGRVAAVGRPADAAGASLAEVCAGLGHPAPSQERRPFAVGFSPKWAPEVLLERDINETVAYEYLFLTLMRRCGLNDLLRREKRSRAFGILTYVVFALAALVGLAAGVTPRVIAISVGIILLLWSIWDGRPATVSTVVLGLALLLLTYTSMEWNGLSALLVLILAIGMLVAAFHELAEFPSPRLSRECARRLRC